MSRARDNADLGDSYGSLAVGVTGGSGLNALSASNLSAGTVPDARFPATLPAASGTNLTALPAANVTGVLPVGVTGGSGLTAIAGVTTGSGNVTITDGNLILDAGNGIDFSDTADGGVTTPSELLDDYEEGTWTPGINGMSFSGGSVTGFYTKVGRLVTATCNFAATTSSGTPHYYLTGLPFTNHDPGRGVVSGIMSYNAFDTTTPGGLVHNNSDTAGFYRIVASGAWATQNVTATSSFYLICGLTYYVA